MNALKTSMLLGIMTLLLVFGSVMALWLTQTFHGISTGIVALGGAVALFVLGRSRAVVSRISGSERSAGSAG